MKKPNVLFILADQHNAKYLGSYGHTQVQTPNLDKLAKAGVRFSKACAQSALCGPSRVSIYSAQYCHNHGHFGFNGNNPSPLPNVFEHFGNSGYRTALLGKGHTPHTWTRDSCDAFRPILDIWNSTGAPEYNKYLADRGLTEIRDDIFFPETEVKAQYLDARPSNMEYVDSVEGWVARQTMGFIDDALDEDQPFFITASFHRPHQLYTPAKEYWDLYKDMDFEMPPNLDWDMKHKSPLLKQAYEHFKGDDWTVFEPGDRASAIRRKLIGYLGNISHLDHSVGEMMEYLAEKGLTENTIVVYGSDHGEYVCEQGNMEKAPGICSDNTTRVPLIWHWPGKIEANLERGEIVENVDIAPTLCALAGLPPMREADGKDITNLLKGQEAVIHDCGLTEFAWSKSIHADKYFYVHYPRMMFQEEYPDGFGELYDLEEDPWEMNNLYFDAQHQEAVRRMQRLLFDKLITSKRFASSFIPRSSQATGQEPSQEACKVGRDGKFHPDLVAAAFLEPDRYEGLHNYNYL